MIRSYFLSTFRLLVKEKLYMAVNAVGLAIGLATCFLIYSWVSFERSFDTHYPDYQRIYRVSTAWDESSEPEVASTYPMVKTRVLSQFPEVETSARIFDEGFLGAKTRIQIDDKVFTDSRFFYGDSTVLSVFGFEMIEGDTRTALSRPNTVILTESISRKYFGDGTPIGKTILIGANKPMEVTGVIDDLPENAHFHFDILASMQSHPWIKGAERNVWSGIVFHTYVKLIPGANPNDLEAKMSVLLDNFPNDPEHIGKGLNLRLQPVSDIHLNSDKRMELEANGNATYVYLFVTIALLVLIVAVINYTNLATARHTQRFKEVGIRKALGASRIQLITQFMTESMVITTLAFIASVFLVEAARPLLLSVSGQGYFSDSFLLPEKLLACFAVTLMIGLATGVSPALVLSAFPPVRLFRPLSGTNPRGVSIRKVLIVSQFTVSIALTICTAVTYMQISYFRNAKLGYNLDHTIVLDISMPGIDEKIAALKSQISSNPNVLGVTAASQLPTDIQTGENIDYSGSESSEVYFISVDPDFFKVMNIPLRQGKELIASINPSDTMNYFVLNERALKTIGWPDGEALGKRMSIRHGNQRPGPVVGVVDDFHFQSLHHGIEPLVFEFSPGDYQYLLVKVKGENLQETLNALSQSWMKLSADLPFDYQFLDQQYNRLYQAEQRSGGLFIIFSAIALFISLLGLFGLSAFAMERRTKEIGVRKILGADAFRIVVLVSRDFVVLICIAFAIALPIGYAFEQKWLSHFAFRADVGMGLFLLCGALNLALAILTLLYHSLKISRTNPVETLRYE